MFFLQMRENLSHNSHPQAVPQKVFLKKCFYAPANNKQATMVHAKDK